MAGGETEKVLAMYTAINSPNAELVTQCIDKLGSRAAGRLKSMPSSPGT